jgi:fructose-specific phosphotransferase system IIC component
MPPKPGVACTGTLTPAVGIAISTPATAIFVMLLRTPDDIAQVMITPFTGSQTAHNATYLVLLDHTKRIRNNVLLVVRQPKPVRRSATARRALVAVGV